MSTYRLDRLIAPRSLAVVGASPCETSVGRHVIANIVAAGFAGPVPHPLGMETIRSALHIPDHFAPVGIIPVGYPLPDVPSPSLKRGAVKPVDFVRWNGW